MNIEIKYKDSDGKELTAQQAAVFDDDYSRVQYVNNKMKRIDYYFDGRLNYGEYYLHSDENIQKVLTELSEVWSGTLLYLDEQVEGCYTIRNWEWYTGTDIIEHGKSVYDLSNREICEVRFKPGSSEITKLCKTYYLDSYGSFIDNGEVYKFGTFKLNYDSPGSPSERARVWIYLPGFDNKEYHISSEKNELTHFLIRPIFIWEDHPYYHAGFPLIPADI